MTSAALWSYFKELLFIFRVCRALRSAPNAFSQKGLLREMPFAVATPPVRRQFWKIRRFSRIANIKIYFPLKMARAQRRPFKSFSDGISAKTVRPVFPPSSRKDVENPGVLFLRGSSAPERTAYRMRTRMTAGMLLSFSLRRASTAPVASSMV